MRISRTNLPPAAFNDTNSRPANVPTAVEERAALRRLKAMGERAGNPDDANWESHFFLAPNVRFTRTPDRDVTAAQPAASESAQGEKQRDHSDQTPSVEQLREVLSTMMILQGGMDMGTAGADALPAQPINDNANPVAPAMGAAVVPAAVQPAKPSTAFAQLSDFAFWESMDFAAESEPDAAASLRQIASVMTAPVAKDPVQDPAISIVSKYHVVECRVPQALRMPNMTQLPYPAPKVHNIGVMPDLPSWNWAPSITFATVEQPAIAVQPEVKETLAKDPIPEELTEAPALPIAVIEPIKSKPVVADQAGVAITKPFKIEQISQLRKVQGEYEFPPRALLQDPPETVGFVMTQEQLERNAGLLESVLEDFGIRGEIIHVRPGPVVTLYEFEPAPGVKSSRVIGLADDIARSMSALSARVAVVPGRNVIGIELPNATRETVYFGELIDSQDFSKTGFKLPLCLGKTIGGEPVIAELAKMPHLLVAGTTGSGKSVAINTMILSLLYRLTPEECRLIMVDPKMLELSVYDGIPHLLTPVVTDPKKAVMALKWAVREMEDRYRKMSRLGVRNIDGYNVRAAQAREKGESISHIVQTGFEKGTGEPIHENKEMDLAPMPYIVVIVDEMADLMMVAGKEIEGAIQRLAQMARAAGIHLIMATQRPSVDVITGTIKANFPTRISFQVTSKIDSRTILGEQGAEQLLGQGDMLHMAGGGRIARVHGPFVSDEEVEKVVAHLKTQGRPEYLETVTTDEEEDDAEEQDTAVFDKSDMAAEDGNDLYDKAVKVVLRDKKCSTSYIQRRLGIGYNKAASLVERMEKEGLVGSANHVGKREIISGNRDSFSDGGMSGDD
jgi:S-DNA-T family DNA segregation ATPase FtsK/SpoIIIE